MPHHHHRSGFFHHHHHRGHHHHGSSLGGALIGGLALGALAGAAAASTPTYTRTRTVVRYVESPEAIAAREAERQAQVERERQAAEARRLELERQQREIFQREEEEEKIRCDQFRMHINLINEVDITHHDILLTKLNALPVLRQPIARYQNVNNTIPRNGGNSLFTAVIYCDALSSELKSQMIHTLVYTKGYDRWVTQLFYDPVYTKMLGDEHLNYLLMTIYGNKLAKTNRLAPEEEKNFLTHCLDKSPKSTRMYLYQSVTPHKKPQMLENWLRTQPDVTQIKKTFECIAEEFGLTQREIDRYLKIAKQGVLNIEIKNRNFTHYDKDDKEVSEFLNKYRNTFASNFSCFFNCRSLQIHRMMQQKEFDFAEAERAWLVEERKLRYL